MQHAPSEQELWWKDIEIFIRKENNSTQCGKKGHPRASYKQYNLLHRDGFSPMGLSTLHNILDVCSSSVRNSLQGLDNFTEKDTQAFDYLESVVDKLGEDCGMGSA